jgi:hypothetical protein
VAGEHHTHMHGQGDWFQGECDRGRDDPSKDVSMLCTPPKAAAKNETHGCLCTVDLPDLFPKERIYIRRHPAKTELGAV